MKYIKAFEDFGDDYPKKGFIELSHKNAMEYADQIVDLIKNAYSKKGGYHDIKSTEDLKNGDITYWVLKDIDLDPDVDLAIGGKFTKNGVKIAVIGQDGSREAKKETIKKMIDLMKSGGFYAEMDKDLADKLNLTIITDENIIRDVINKDLKYNQDCSYDRKIGGSQHTKVLVGKPQ